MYRKEERKKEKQKEGKKKMIYPNEIYQNVTNVARIIYIKLRQRQRGKLSPTITAKTKAITTVFILRCHHVVRDSVGCGYCTLRAQDWLRLRIQSLLYRSQGPLGKDYFRTTIFFPANFVTLLAVI